MIFIASEIFDDIVKVYWNCSHNRGFIMNLLKNILFVSYLKNKGVRRICFVIGIGLSIFISCMIILDIVNNNVDVEYKNLQALNEKYYSVHGYNYDKYTDDDLKEYWCFTKNLKKYGINKMILDALSSYRNIFESPWCYHYQHECDMLESIKEEPIHIKCSGIESSGIGYRFSIVSGLLFRLFALLIYFYIPFIFTCCIKIMYIFIRRIGLWIYAGFKEK